MTSYPEKIPKVSKIDNFYFNLRNSQFIKSELESQIETLDSRIDKIIEHFSVDDFPIIRAILNFTEDRDNLKNISKALDRIADLIAAKNSLIPKLKVIETAEQDPNWFAMTFGDFSADIELDIDSFDFDSEN